MVSVPVGWLLLYSSFRYWTVLVSIALLPYAVHRGWHEIALRGSQSVSVPRHFEVKEDESKITDLVFEVDTKERKIK